MTYYSQWDADDLRDWMDKQPREEDEVYEEEKTVHDCGNCLKCLGLHWSDFC